MDAASQPARPARVEKCPYCGSANLARRVEVNQTAEAGRIGLGYHTRFLLIGTESLLADLCDECGSVVRLFVEVPARKWVTK